MSPDFETPKMRRNPQQTRSQKRVDAILSAAAQVLSDHGYEAATTNAIAEKAGTSIGSIYRFFPDKSAIFAALSEQYMEESMELTNQILKPPICNLPLPVLIDLLVESFDHLFKTQPALKSVWFYAEAIPELRDLDKKHGDIIVDQIAALLEAKGLATEHEHRRLIALICAELVHALMRLMLVIPEEGQSNLKVEFKDILVSYLQKHVPPPAKN